MHGRGASWSPANRFEKLHVDVMDTDVVDPVAALEERPRRATQFFRDGTKTIIARNDSPDVGFETSRQSVPRLRAWLHLLFCAADARVSRFFRRARFREQNHGEEDAPQVARSGAVFAEMETASHRR